MTESDEERRMLLKCHEVKSHKNNYLPHLRNNTPNNVIDCSGKYRFISEFSATGWIHFPVTWLFYFSTLLIIMKWQITEWFLNTDDLQSVQSLNANKHLLCLELLFLNGSYFPISQGAFFTKSFLFAISFLIAWRKKKKISKKPET